MAMRPTLWRTLRFDLLAILAIVCIASLWELLRHPILERAQEQGVEGSRPPDRTEGDVLLLLPDTPSAEATDFGELDCSYGWFNALWQEYGSFASTLTQRLSPEVLAGRSVVIIPKRVATSIPPLGIKALEHFVERGGQVIVEQPGKEWSRLTAASPSAKRRVAQTITSTEGLGARGPLRRHLPDVPLFGEMTRLPAQDPWPQGTSLLDIDGAPGITLRTLGRGRVYTVLFEFGCTQIALQQGLPRQGMSFLDDRGALSTERLPASRRVANERMRTSRVPYADLLEHAILSHPSTARPLPKLWYYPGTTAGALVIEHAAPQNVRAALGWAQWSASAQGSSTVFVAPDRTNATQIALLRDQERADVGLLWVRGGPLREPMTRRIGVGALRPFSKELSLSEQIDALSALDPDMSLRVTRSEGTMMANDFSAHFSHLAHARVHLDATMGPSQKEEWGFLFGTGFPFYPLDARGLPLPVLEHPFVLHELSLTEERLSRFLGNSQAYFHQVIALSLPAWSMREHPRAGALLALRQALELAQTHDHWVTTTHELTRFLSARRQSVVTSRWASKERRLTISVNLVASSSRRIEQAVPGIAFPRVFDTGEVERVEVDGEEVSMRKVATSGSSTDRIVSVPPGRHTISVFYHTPALPEIED